MKKWMPFLLIASLNLNAAEIDHQRAHINYMLGCQGCHQADGSGLPGSVPNMQNFVGQFIGVPGGREFLIQVPGSANSAISDAELAELLNWILTTKSKQQLPEDFQFYTETEVAAVRYKKMLDVAAVREKIVAKFPNKQ